ncbi:hypothetical protein C900_05361 [Fulvivirga imtechensis AK7]|uniref:Uncharacterized protein n=1 Tax=Fulvivirga imtechensis AK7 TaxID=1237149 RepID=L8JK25_9BACT|nr:hypothetical protein [Fulvivirga imtechensis]ELR69165.1 hypothetical protein C900_05361 [Fulvivirga imtechensis AK7]
MKKYTDEELEKLAQDTFKKTPGAKRLLIAANGTIFREDQAYRADEYCKANQVEVHPFERGGKAAKAQADEKAKAESEQVKEETLPKPKSNKGKGKQA